jgi:hypothetical protein
MLFIMAAIDSAWALSDRAKTCCISSTEAVLERSLEEASLLAWAEHTSKARTNRAAIAVVGLEKLLYQDIYVVSGEHSAKLLR